MYAHAGKVYRTEDGGKNWTTLANDRFFNCLAMDSATSSRLLAGTREGVVFLSSNGGTTWNDVTANLPGYLIKDVAFGSGNELWVGTGISGGVGNGFLYHSANLGMSWSPVNLPGQATDSEIHTIFADPQNREIVYIGLRNIYNTMFDSQNDVYLLRTTNGGTNWALIRLPSTDAMVNIMGRVSYDTMLYVSSGGSAFRSGDGGQTWTGIRPPGFNGDMYDIAVDRLQYGRASTCLAGLWPCQEHRSRC
jgi:photosystem II stability/assembly factor-like uncharacterized protein